MPYECLVCLDSLGPAARFALQLYQVAQPTLVCVVKLEGAASPSKSRVDISASLELARQSIGGASRRRAQSGSFGLKPLLELLSVVNKESSEQVAPINLESFLKPVRPEAHVERRGITEDPLEVDCDFFITARQDRVVAKSVPQSVKSLSERRPSVILIGIRPEQCEECVAPMESARLGDAEVGQEGDSLRLSK
jgi:hypothetical protein